ncbi:MAG TPA: DUF503 domain-containing protein [Acidimicrobiia bacterium]
MRAAAVKVEIHLPAPQSLKAKRAVLRPVLEGMKKLGSYSVAEVDRHDSWQRAVIGIAVVAPDGVSLDMQISRLRRYLDSCLEIEVVGVAVTELEEPE